jgi:deoxycytidylate deaminase
MSRDLRFLHLAFKYTYKSTHRMPVAAILARGSIPLAYGINTNKSHPRQKLVNNINRCGHAELLTIVGLNLEVTSGSTVYVSRRLKSGVSGLSKPCKACEELLRAAGVRRVVYSIDSINYGVMNLG